MNKTVTVLLALILLVLVVLMAGQWKAPIRQQELVNAQVKEAQQLENLARSVSQLDTRLKSLEALPESNKALGDLVATLREEQRQTRELLAQGITVRTSGDVAIAGTSGGDDTPQNVVSQQPVTYGDGVHKLGENFLLPHVSDFDPSKVGGTLLRFMTTPPGLNNILESAANTSTLNGYANDSLCTKDLVDRELWRSSLATSVIIEDNYKKFTFTIRPGIMWQTPKIAEEAGFEWLQEKVELTAGDFAFFLELVNDPVVECPGLKTYYSDIESVETPDDHTLVVTWKEANYTNITFTLGLAPFPRHVYTRDEKGQPYPEADIGLRFNKHWFDTRQQLIGVGPYILEEYRFDQKIVFRRNADHWAGGTHFERLEFDCTLKDDTPRLVAFKNKQLHVSSLTPIQFRTEILEGGEQRFAPFAEGDPQAGWGGELGWHKIVAKAYNYLGWNMRNPMFADKRTRQAMSYAFPKKRIIKEVFSDIGRPQLTNLHLDSAYHNSDLKPYDFDLDMARELLAEAGWSDSDGDGLLDMEHNGTRIPFSFTIKYYANSPEWDNTLTIYKSELKKLGIDISLLPQEWPQLIKTYEDQDFEAVGGGWRLGGDVDFKQLWHSEEADKLKSSNFVGFKNERADELAEKLRKTFDLQERIAIAKEFQALIHEEQPYTFFRCSEGIFTWQNKTSEDALILDGVTKGLERNHPFTQTEHSTWWLPR